MPIKRGVSVENNFTGGRNSQATGLNFPENACVDELNCVFNERGFVTRRPSFDFEQNYVSEAISVGDAAKTTFLWKNASDDTSATLLVVQMGATLYFYTTESVLGVSPNRIADIVNLNDFLTSGSTNPHTSECQFASGLGKLFVVHPKCEPFAVGYNAVSKAISTSPITIKIRDFTGVTDTVASTTERPAALTDAHKYNLLNQGWDTTKITAFHTALAVYPSNADVWWIFKDDTLTFNPGTTNASVSRGNAQAPKGSFILDAFNQQRDTASGIGTIADVDTDGARPSAVAFFGGRAFYAGTNFAGFTDRVYFSQTIETDDQFGKCYQAADPSAEDVFELQPTDGGVIRIPGTGQIFKLWNLSNYLVVFAEHGIWLITGNQGLGFIATDYTVSFLSATRAISATSFLDVQGYPAWWNIDGIYYIQPDQTGGGLNVNSLTDQKIKDFYLEIPISNKRLARGAYNNFTHVAQWLYREEVSGTLKDNYTFQKVLNFNVLSGAFYTWDIPFDVVNLNGIVVAETGGSSLIEEVNVIDIAADLVVDHNGNQVITFGLGTASNLHTTTKYLVSYNTASLTWAECANFRGDYIDWFTVDGVGEDYESYFITGYKVHSEGQRRMQIPYLYIFSDATDVTEFRMQTIWDFATQNNDSRWSNPQTLVNTDTDKAYVRDKIRLRGHGVAVQFKISDVTGKGFNIIGWSTEEDVNATP